MDGPNRSELITVDEARAEFGLSERAAWYAMRDGGVPRYRLRNAGKRTFVRRADLARVLAVGVPYAPVPPGPSRPRASDPDGSDAATT